MDLVPGDLEKLGTPVVWKEFEAITRAAEGNDVNLTPIERFAFYERAKKAFCVVATSGKRLLISFVLLWALLFCFFFFCLFVCLFFLFSCLYDNSILLKALSYSYSPRGVTSFHFSQTGCSLHWFFLRYRSLWKYYFEKGCHFLINDAQFTLSKAVRPSVDNNNIHTWRVIVHAPS